MRDWDPGTWGRRPDIIAGSAHWYKFDRYKIVEHAGELVICPERNARFLSYRPLREEHLLTDALTLGRVCRNEHTGGQSSKSSLMDISRRLAPKVLSFCSNYGLLGMGWRSIVGVDASVDFVWVRCHDDRLRKVRFSKASRPHFVGSVPNVSDLMACKESALRLYSESAVRIAMLFDALLLKFELALTMREGVVAHPSEEWSKEFLEVHGTSNISLSVTPSAEPQLDFLFPTLFDAIRVAMILALASSDWPFRLCAFEHCRRPFRVNDPRGRYCSDRCSNADRQRRWRETHRGDKTVGKTVGEFSAKQAEIRGRSATPERH